MYSGYTSLKIDSLEIFQSKLLHWADQFSTFCYLDSNQCADRYGRFDFLIGVDALEHYTMEDLEDIYREIFLMGYFGYISDSSIPYSLNEFIPFEKSYFFRPRYIIYGYEGRVYFNRNYSEMMEIVSQIETITVTFPKNTAPLQFQHITTQEEYLNNVKTIQHKIRKGYFYQLNYCIELQAENVLLHPIASYIQTNKETKAPMSALLKMGEKYVLSYSPERYMTKRQDTMIAQPMKGTARRNLSDTILDEEIKLTLENDPKERAENTMIVDLIRHDMTPYTAVGSIQVDELCQVYSYPAVHQMISTISARLIDDMDTIPALLCTLPAGSMTGAPKKEVISHISEVENFCRNIYSGNIGYIDTEGDYDFNVVIRTLEYDAHTHRASIHVGSAITLQSIPEQEYEECLLKADSILQHL